MYEQPRAADEMLARIGDLLRATLQAQTQQHRLADELKLLRLYLDIQRARFGEQCLHVVLDMAPGLDSLQVPFLVLQPLAENAFEHGGAARHDVSIHILSDDEYLHLRVRNQGDANAHPHHGHGIGLVNIQARLRYLYGEQASLTLKAFEGGTEAHLCLPLGAASA
jgi:LytS/YehU family sensor histidine kinase